MRNLTTLLLALFISLNSSITLADFETADDIYITQHWFSLTTGYDIETKHEKLGTIYRKFLSLLAYEFYDSSDNKLAIARSRFFSLTAHFDIYDTFGNILGVAEEQFFTLFATFKIYGPDGITELAIAKLNFFGTEFIIYDPITKQKMAKLYRAFFRLKNNWIFKVTDRPLLDKKEIDSRVLMTVIAFQGDREYWQSRNRQYHITVDSKVDIGPKQLKFFIKEVDRIIKQESLTDIREPDTEILESIANELEENYRKKDPLNMDINQLSNAEKLHTFVDYCLQVAQSNDISASKKKGILYLLKIRLSDELNSFVKKT